MGVTLFYNTECPDCARRARCTARLDWLRRVRISTDDSPMGPVSRGPTGYCSTSHPSGGSPVVANRAAMVTPQGLTGGLWLVARSPRPVEYQTHH